MYTQKSLSAGPLLAYNLPADVDVMAVQKAVDSAMLVAMEAIRSPKGSSRCAVCQLANATVILCIKCHLQK